MYLFRVDSRDETENSENTEKADGDKNDKKESYKRPVWMKQQSKKQHPSKKAKKPVVSKQVKPAPATSTAPIANDVKEGEKVKKPKEPKKIEEGRFQNLKSIANFQSSVILHVIYCRVSRGTAG